VEAVMVLSDVGEGHLLEWMASLLHGQVCPCSRLATSPA